MKKFILFLFTYLTLTSEMLLAQNVKIYTYDTLPPLAYKNTQGILTGVYIEIVKKAISRMPDYTVTFVNVPWVRAKMIMEKGRGFAILPPYFHAHDWLTQDEPKRPYIWPYSLPLIIQENIIICNKNIKLKPDAIYPDDYKGLTFAMWKGDGRAGVKFEKMAKEKKINVHLTRNLKNSIIFLQKNRADCTITSKLPFAWYIKQMKQSGEYQENDNGVILNEVFTISRSEGYLGYTDIDDEINFPFKKDFSIKFDEEIKKLKKAGEIQKIIDTFIK